MTIAQIGTYHAQMGENRFLELYERGRISDLRSLSRAWHDVVKRTHPDATGSDESSQLFSRLHEEYHAARAFIAARMDNPEFPEPLAPSPSSATPATNEGVTLPSRRDFYRELNDIIRRGFPLDPENPRLPSFYFRSRLVLTAWLDKFVGPESFARFEKDMLALKKNSTYFTTGPLMPVLYQICDFHLMGMDWAAKFARAEWPRMERLLQRRDKTDLLAVLAFLVNDLKEGPALV